MSLPITPSVEPAEPTGDANFTRRFLRQVAPTVALAFLLIVIVSCFLAPLIAPYGALTQQLSAALRGPSPAHLLGTDTLGRDVFSRLLYGGVVSIDGVAECLVVFLVLGVVLGLIAGYSGAFLDRVISAVVEIAMSLPAIVIILAVVSLFSRNLDATMIVFGILGSGGLVRVVRASTQSISGDLYVDAARVSGLGNFRILFRHILPRLVGPIIVQVSLFAGVALGVQTGLGFLGLGTPPPEPSWGGMVGEAATVVTNDPWLLVPSGGLIALVIIACGVIGDGARDTNAATRQRTASTPRVRRVLDQTSPAERAYQVLEVQDLTVRFGQDAEAVSHISFGINSGEIVGLVGESGSGKTVTALTALGLVPAGGTVETGRVLLGDLDVTTADYRQLEAIRGSKIAYVSQEPMVALDPSFTVRNLLVEVIRRHNKTTRTAADKSALDLLSSVRIPNPAAVMRKYPHELSGGMAQRVAIAVALAGNPSVLIADEPTTALDVTVQAHILALLRALRDERGMSIIVVTHDLGVVADLCERAIVMQHGRIVEEAEVVKLFENPTHEYTRSLIAATPSIVDLNR
jgi:peptide/nickel transport system permease protein